LVLTHWSIPYGRHVARERDARYESRLGDFALRLVEHRRAAGLTQAALAERAGLSVTMVQNLERHSDGGNPRLTTLWALADALGISTADLVGG
jgi:transcriptional regulator with XRE-family HTH domain